jgi:adenosylhomocysteine nucleosidase
MGEIAGRFVSISGSASALSDRAELMRVHQFVRSLALEIVGRGGGLTEALGLDPRIDADDPLSAQTYLWTMLEAAQEAVTTGRAKSQRPLVKVVCNLARLADYVPPHRAVFFESLRQRGLIQLVPTPAQIHTGGEIRSIQVEHAHAFVLVGGGRGAHDLVSKARLSERPVLPMDTRIGSICDDGEASAEHWRRLLHDPSDYLRVPGRDLRASASAWNLGSQHRDPAALAVDVADLLDAAAYPLSPVQALVLTVVPVELKATCDLLSIPTDSATRTPRGTWVLRSGPIAVACVGQPGNPSSAVLTAELLQTLRPAVAVLAGIAGGDPDGTQIGDVVIAERVVNYESAAVVGDVEPDAEARPDTIKIGHAARQFLMPYQAGGISQRLAERYGLDPIKVSLDPIASGEKLVRSAAFFKRQAQHHAKTRAIEMEGYGFAGACEHVGVSWFVVRGISDHANEAKADGPQSGAAQNAAAVALDLCDEWMRVHLVHPRR